jgi:hypothetical protein
MLKPSWSRFGGGAALIERHNIGRVSIVVDLPRFRGEVRSWDQGTWFGASYPGEAET